ncbi:MAG: DUF819 family protein [Xanthomonadales bacterium]|nr:DUF819 family protein [Xanthomonadales bacterium]
MITSPFAYVAILLFVAGCLRFIEQRYKQSLFFTYLPAAVLLYLVIMLLSTFGVWERNADISAAYFELKRALLPAMIFLMLLKSDLRQIRRLGGKMLLGFFSASISIGIGFVVSFAIFSQWMEPQAWKAFAALSGSWMGGTGNMLAIQGSLNIAESEMGYTLLIDSIDYALWVMLLLALVPFANIFNRWTKADTQVLDRIGQELEENGGEKQRPVEFTDMIFLLGIAFAVAALSLTVAKILPTTAFFTVTTWTVLIVTVTGVLAAMTPLGKMPGSGEMSSVMLFVIIALIASRANFAELGQAPLYVVAGMVILLVHALVMLCVARFFKLDLFTCGIASLANIGGVASAPILAAAYSQVLIPIGVLMAMIGYIIGTGGGLLVGKVLSLIT